MIRTSWITIKKMALKSLLFCQGRQSIRIIQLTLSFSDLGFALASFNPSSCSILTRNSYLPGLNSEISSKQEQFKEVFVISDEQPWGGGRLTSTKLFFTLTCSACDTQNEHCGYHYTVGKAKEKRFLLQFRRTSCC